MSSDPFITYSAAVDVIRHAKGTSIGKAQTLLREAKKSGEVRSRIGENQVYLMADDGIVGLRNPQQPPIDAFMFSGDDLAFWLGNGNSQQAKSTYRWPGDGDLVAEGRVLIAAGMSKRRAAERLASRAEGGTIDQRIDRLRKLF